MSLSLFEKYELRRNKFKPGSVWIDMGHHIIKELEIVKRVDIPKDKQIFKMFLNNDNIFFKIKRSSHSGEYSPGEYCCWSIDYMTNNYKPMLSSK